MKKFLIVLGIILIIVLGAFIYIRFFYTKSFSPEDEVKFEDKGLKITIAYNRPYKKGRVIFGGLEPYGEVWRTGANEATTFETNKDLTFGDRTLKAGKYSLWTIPREQMWTVIFNSETGQWGVDYNGEANHDPSEDALSVDVNSVTLEKEFEQFTIAIENSDDDYELTLIWDKTLVAVPFAVK